MRILKRFSHFHEQTYLLLCLIRSKGVNLAAILGGSLGAACVIVVSLVAVLFCLRTRRRAVRNEQINIDDMQQHQPTFSPQPTIPQVGQMQYENEAFTSQPSPQPFQPQRRSVHSPLEGYYQPSPIRPPSFPSAIPFSDTSQAMSATEATKGTPTNIRIGARSPSLSLSPPPPTYEN